MSDLGVGAGKRHVGERLRVMLRTIRLAQNRQENSQIPSLSMTFKKAADPAEELWRAESDRIRRLSVF
jgi:hypothetical protein